MPQLHFGALQRCHDTEPLCAPDHGDEAPQHGEIAINRSNRRHIFRQISKRENLSHHWIL